MGRKDGRTDFKKGHLDDIDQSKIKKSAKKTNKKKKILIIATLLFSIAISFLGWRVWSALEKIFDNGLNPMTFLSSLKPTALAGESDGRTNILLLGTGDKDWESADLTDTMMVASVNIKAKSVTLISIPRDFYVKISNYGPSKINAAYAYGEANKYPGGGGALALKTVSEVLDIPIHYYAKVDFTGFKKAVDAVGGIEIIPTDDLYDPFYPDGSVKFKKGKTYKMNGDLALKYSRSRQTTSDFDRARRQQEVLLKVKEKTTSTGALANPATILNMIDILGEHIRTDLKPNEIKRLIEISKEINQSNIKNVVLDYENTNLVTTGTFEGAGSIVYPRLGFFKFGEIQEFVYELLSEKTSSSIDYKKEKAKIKIENGTARNGLAGLLKEKLEAEGFNVIEVTTADNSSYQKTIIYDYSAGAKPETVKMLEKKLAVSATKNSGSKLYDILIIIGANYE